MFQTLLTVQPSVLYCIPASLLIEIITSHSFIINGSLIALGRAEKQLKLYKLCRAFGIVDIGVHFSEKYLYRFFSPHRC